MSRYISVDIPTSNESWGHWWVPDQAVQVIEFLETEHPGYEFVQFVTSPGHGGYGEFALMRMVK